MAERNASKVQLDFPELIADLIDQLRLGGQVGLLDFLDSVQPTYIVAAREGALRLTVEQPLWTSAQIFTDQTNSPAVNAVLATTGQLPAGDYDVKAICTWANIAAAAVGPVFDLQHRNAADAATLASIPFASVTGAVNTPTGVIVIDYATTLALDERLRWQLLKAIPPGETSTVIMARRRTTP